MPKTRCAMYSTTILLTLIIVLIHTSLASGCGRRDRDPPKIHWVMQHPQTPEYEDSVLILAYITDSKSGVANATLCYTINEGQKVKIAMNRSGGLFFAEIPAQPYNSTVAYMICAYDKAGNKACSSENIYVVDDFHPPTITFIQQVPAKPNYNETVTVLVNVTEPKNASGVKELRLTFWEGANWATTFMEPYGTLYKATIPEFPYGTMVQYKVSAVDYAGNTASLDVYSYKVEDQFMPVVVFQKPQNGSFVSKNVNVTVHVHDDNLYEAKLMLDGTVLAVWTQTGAHAYELNTTVLSDNVYKLELEAVDRAGNKVENAISIIVDNTMPLVEILQPVNKSVVSGLVLIEARADDANFESMELKIDGVTQMWEAKTLVHAWDTTVFSDGEHKIMLTAADKAGNKVEEEVVVVVDNTAPTINNIVWTPKTPTANETVNVSAQITEDGSGIRNIFLWFKLLGEEWQKMSMTLQDGNWTATIQGFEEGATVIFYVECVDKAGNIARSAENYYVVKAVTAEGFPGFPLHWLALAVLAIFGILASTAHYLRRRKRAQPTATVLVSSL